jgi:hypothetical protein
LGHLRFKAAAKDAIVVALHDAGCQWRLPSRRDEL